MCYTDNSLGSEIKAEGSLSYVCISLERKLKIDEPLSYRDKLPWSEIKTEGILCYRDNSLGSDIKGAWPFVLHR